MTAIAEKNVHFVRDGQKYSLIVDEALLKQLGIDETTKLQVSVDGKAISIAPATSAPAFKDVMNKVHSEWADVFKKLAE